MSSVSHPTRWALVAALAVTSCAFALPVSSAQEAPTLPMRKAGLWELKTEMDQGTGPRKAEFDICIGATMEKNTVEGSMIEHRNRCKTYEIDNDGTTTTVKAENCTFNTASVASQTVMTGDFKKAFSVKIESTTVRKKGEQSNVIKRKISQTGTYKSADCGDLKPGQAKAAGGEAVDVQ